MVPRSSCSRAASSPALLQVRAWDEGLQVVAGGAFGGAGELGLSPGAGRSGASGGWVGVGRAV